MLFYRYSAFRDLIVLAAVLLTLSLLALALWLYLICGRGFFWRLGPFLPPSVNTGEWPPVVAVVAARDEAEVISRSLGSLRRQQYSGRFAIILVDDKSLDATAELARGVASGNGPRVEIIAGEPPPPAWTGKLWALTQGAERANRLVPDARYIWFTDADIEHDSGILRDLVSKAETGNLDLVSTMVRLHCTSPWERLLIPAFIFFFQKLYPFRLVNDPRRRIAAAAGGSMLVRAPSLRGAGGLTAIRGELIDDCALARLIKKNGPIWLGLTGRSLCIRGYGLADIWRMVARSAYTQLRHSPIQLAATSAVMMLLYFVPVAALAWGCASSHYACALAGGATWILMASVYRPMMRLYGQASLASLFLPAAAFLFTIMTLDSARRHWQGKGGMWKGRARP